MLVHIKNNRASPETFAPAPEGEAVFTIARERLEATAARYPRVARNLDRLLEGKPIENVGRLELGV